MRQLYTPERLQKIDATLIELEVRLQTSAQRTNTHQLHDELREVSSDDIDAASLAEALDVANMSRDIALRMSQEVRAARARIELGTYGICVSQSAKDCTKRVPAERLKELPFAANCVPCQRRIEQQQAATGEAIRRHYEAFSYSQEETREPKKKRKPKHD